VVVDFSKRSDPDFTKKQSTPKVTFRHQVIDYRAYCDKFGYCISPTSPGLLIESPANT
jgi:hypothetical protein